MKILCKWKICGEYADGFKITVGGNSESECMEKLGNLTEKHGELVWYGGYADEDYTDGEYTGKGVC